MATITITIPAQTITLYSDVVGSGWDYPADSFSADDATHLRARDLHIVTTTVREAISKAMWKDCKVDTYSDADLDCTVTIG